MVLSSGAIYVGMRACNAPINKLHVRTYSRMYTCKVCLQCAYVYMCACSVCMYVMYVCMECMHVCMCVM